MAFMKHQKGKSVRQDHFNRRHKELTGSEFLIKFRDIVNATIMKRLATIVHDLLSKTGSYKVTEERGDIVFGNAFDISTDDFKLAA